MNEREIAEWYNSLARSYDELYGKEQSLKHEVVLKAVEKKRFNLLIDVGCGSGVLLERTSRNCDQSVGFDLSIKMLKIAKTRRSERTDFVLASSRCLPIVDGRVDCLVSISTLEANENVPEHLAELKRVRSPNGVEIVSLFHYQSDDANDIVTGSTRSLKLSDRETVYFLERG